MVKTLSTTEALVRERARIAREMLVRIAKMRAALEWYASEDNWRAGGPQHDPDPSRAMADRGQRARAALKTEVRS